MHSVYTLVIGFPSFQKTARINPSSLFIASVRRSGLRHRRTTLAHIRE